MLNVVELHPAAPLEDVAATLRHIADEFERGEYGLITTAVLCLAHNTEKSIDGYVESDPSLEVFAFGPRSDYFTAAGVLAKALEGV